MRSLACLMLCCLLLFAVSCEVKKTTLPEQSGGLESILFDEEIAPLAGDEFLYIQSLDFTALLKPGNVLSLRLFTLEDVLPVGFETDAEGWLIFGRDSGSIWTNRALHQFTFASEGGKLKNLICKVDLQVKTEQETILISSGFKTKRLLESGIYPAFLPGAETGSGLAFGLLEQLGDVMVEGLYASHFMFRLNTMDSNFNIVSYGNWHSSLLMQDLRTVILNENSTPALAINAADEYTQFESYVVSRQGIVEATPKNTYFRVRSGNFPQTLIYSSTLAGLGSNHFATDQSNLSTDGSLIPAQNGKHSRRLWLEDGVFKAVHSADFKLHIRWGWYGLYGTILPMGQLSYYADPWSSEVNHVVNDLNQNYYSRITAFDMRLNGAPFPALPQFMNPRIVSHSDGSQWLRVLNVNDFARHCILSDLAPGNHQIQIAAVDLQDVCDPEPASISIQLSPMVHASARQGILIVDNTQDSATYAPPGIINPLYQNSIPGTWGQVDYHELMIEGELQELSANRLINYSAVIWHADNATANSQLDLCVDAMEIYLANGGKLILSGSLNLLSDFGVIDRIAPQFLQQRLGLPSLASVEALSNSINTNTFFQRGIGIDGYPDLRLKYHDPEDEQNYPEMSFINVINIRKGLGSVMYFNPGYTMNYAHEFGCKTPDYPASPPSQEQYDLYSSKYVSYSFSNGLSKVHVFGCPLAYMRPDDVAANLQYILSDMLNPESRTRRIK